MKSLSLSTAWLKEPWMYRAFQHLVGPNARRHFLQDYVKLEPGHRVLDVGCGPGLLLAEMLKSGYQMDYLGLDIDSKYIEAAGRRYGPEHFLELDINNAEHTDLGKFDRVMAYGLLHHLADDEVERFFAFAASVLKPGGHIVTLDGTLVANQNRFARILIALDRGQNIRAPEHYQLLANRHLSTCRLSVRHDLQAVPYSCAIVLSSNA